MAIAHYGLSNFGSYLEQYSKIRYEIEKTTSQYDKEKLEERLAKLSGGDAVIRVGAPTEAEMKSKKEAIDNAISSTKAAVAEGIVPGGGLALLRCVEAVSKEEAAFEGDEKTGVQILKRVHSRPLPARSRKTRQPTAALSWRACSAARAISASTPRARNMSISWTRPSSIL